MSQKERDRLQVLPEVEKGHWTQSAAGLQLGLTERWVRELLGRLRGRVSNRRLPTAGRRVLCGTTPPRRTGGGCRSIWVAGGGRWRSTRTRLACLR